MRRFFWSAILIIASFSAFSQSCFFGRYVDTIATDLLVYDDLKYATADPYGILPSQDLHLDFYEPFGDTLSKRPLIIFSYGGAFLIGNKIQPFGPDFCRHFAKRGYATAAINYRLGLNATDGASVERAIHRTVQDIRAAIRFFAENAAIFRIDTNIIFLTGTSAGCIASLTSAFMEDDERYPSSYGILLEPQDLGSLDSSGNAYNRNREVKVKGIINNWGALTDTALINNLSHDSVPVISFHGTNDLIVPFIYGAPFQVPLLPAMYGSFTIHEHLDRLGIYNRLVPLQGAGHEPELLNWNYLDTIFNNSEDFLYEILEPKTSAINGAVEIFVNETAQYSVRYHNGSNYCWEVQQANSVQQTLNEIEVMWSDTGFFEVSVVEKNYLDATGERQSFMVHVKPYPSTAISSQSLENDIILFPNPVDDVLTIEFKGKHKDQAFLELFDVSGKKILQKALKPSNQVDLSHLAGGVYHLKIFAGKRSLLKKIVKLE